MQQTYMYLQISTKMNDNAHSACTIHRSQLRHSVLSFSNLLHAKKSCKERQTTLTRTLSETTVENTIESYRLFAFINIKFNCICNRITIILDNSERKVIFGTWTNYCLRFYFIIKH